MILQSCGEKIQAGAVCGHSGYRPSSQLESVAGNLYEDVGEVAMTLINLRFKQAEDLLTSIHLRGDIA